MTTLTQVLIRDRNRCIDCGSTDGLEVVDRTVMDGDGSISNLITICTKDKNAHQLDQSRAFALGYLINRCRGWITPDRIPVFDRTMQVWFQLGTDGSRTAIQPTLAAEYLFIAGNLDVERRRA